MYLVAQIFYKDTKSVYTVFKPFVGGFAWKMNS